MKARVQQPAFPFSLWLYTPGAGYEAVSRATAAAAASAGAAFHAFGPGSAGMPLQSILAGGQPVPSDIPPDEPVLLIAGAGRRELDGILRALREKSAEEGAESVALKAVVTPTNLGWVFSDLARELKQEHALMHSKP